MRTTLVAVSIRILAAGLAASAAAPASAQTNEVIASVPFDFVVGSERLPAGTYIIRPASEDPGIIAIESADGRRAAVTLTIPAKENFESQASKPTLTFEARGADHVLARVVEGDGTEREIVRVHHPRDQAATGPDR